MEYDSIILELMSRIQKLEEEVNQLKAAAAQAPSQSPAPVPSQPAPQEQERSYLSPAAASSYTKTTEEMIDVCYEYGKKAYEEHISDLWSLVPRVQEQTDMNGNSAFIYIYVVKCLLEGEVYKRAINISASRKYLDRISREYGREGLQRALSAMAQHISYRKSLGHVIDSLEKLYSQYKSRF